MIQLSSMSPVPLVQILKFGIQSHNENSVLGENCNLGQEYLLENDGVKRIA